MTGAAIILLGTELTRGEIQDSHLVFLAKELLRLGISISRVSILPDSREDAGKEIALSAGMYPLVIVAGGLGPTSDDITRDAVSDAAGVALEFREEALETVKRRFPGGITGDSNKKQAFVPAGFEVIDNPLGTACGFAGKIGNTLVIVLPGPRVEMQAMFYDSAIKMLASKASGAQAETISGSIFLAGESLIQDEITRLGIGDVHLATRLEKDRVIIRLTGRTESLKHAFLCLEKAFGPIAVRMENLSAAELLIRALKAQGSLIAFAESCTGGLLSERITDIPGSSSVFSGGCVVYANEAKSRFLGIDRSLIEAEGAVSERVAIEMAKSAIERFKTDFAIAVTGIAGPDGGTVSRPVGTVWISLCGKRKDALARCFHFSGVRDRVRGKAAVCAFLSAEAYILGKPINLNSNF